MKKLTITIDSLGRSKVEADGFNGVGCIAAAKPVLSALTTDDNLVTEEKTELHIQCGEEHIEMEEV